MARIVVFQHGPKGPGRFGTTFRDHGFRLDIRRLDLPASDAPPGTRTTVPPDLDGIHGVLSLGGFQNVDQAHPWLAAERDFLRAAHDRGLPVVGICLGHQLLCQALGGEVGPMEDGPEFGFHPVTLTTAGQTDTILAGVPWSVPVFHTHAYEAKGVPPGATLLASSPRCKVQIIRAGLRTYGFQFHPEFDREAILACSSDGSGLCGQAGMTSEALARAADEHYDRFALVSNRLAVNLASFAFPFAELNAV